MLTDTEREALHVAVCSCSDLSDECLVRMDYDPSGLGVAVEAIVAAREGVWRAPIEALAADPSAMFEAMYGAASDPDGVLMLSVIAAVNALRAALGSVSAPGNEAGQ